MIAFFDASALIYLLEGAAPFASRVCHGLRMPDALQAASCLQLGPAHRLLTGDGAFARVHLRPRTTEYRALRQSANDAETAYRR